MNTRIINVSIAIFTIIAIHVQSHPSEQRNNDNNVDVHDDDSDVTFETVKNLKDNNTVLIIDVREPQELVETGRIPGSINIPVDTLERTLKNLPADEFQRTYRRQKPTNETVLVVYCTVGVRSARAQKIASNLGYFNAKNYPGSWEDWEAKTKVTTS